MRAILALAVVACSSRVTYAPAPLPQTVAGDAAAFGPGLLAASGDEVRFELNRPAYVTVLRVWQEEGVHASTSGGEAWFGSIELVYPFDPRQPMVTRGGGLASHQLRFKPGARRVGLPVPQAAAYETELTDARTAAGIASQRQCAVMPRPTDPPRPAGTVTPEARSQTTGAVVSAPTLAPCVVHVPPTTRQWKWHPAPERLGTHQVLVIVSESRVDLAAVGRAVDGLDAAVTALPGLSAAVLAAHRGPWAAYMVRVD